jgi:hypothetical protein
VINYFASQCESRRGEVINIGLLIVRLDYWLPVGVVEFGDTSCVIVVLVALPAKVSFPGNLVFSGVPPDIF